MTEQSTTAGSDGRTLKLGILMGVTGGLAELGPPIRNAAQFAAEYAGNADGFTVDVGFEDTGTDPSQGVEGAQALADDGYPMFVGALASAVSLAAARNVSVPRGIVQCSPSSTAPALGDLDDEGFLWRTVPTDRLQAELLARVGRQRREATTASLLTINNAYGTELGDAVATAWADRGGTVQANVSFAPEQSSYEAPLKEALADQPDLLVVVGYPRSAGQLFRDFYADYSQDFCDVLVSDGLRDPQLPDRVDNAMRNVWGTSPTADGPSKDWFDDVAPESAKGSPFTAHAFDAAAVLLLANAAAGANDGAAIRDELRRIANPGGTEIRAEALQDGLVRAADGEDVQYRGVASPVEFDDSGDLKTATYELFRFNADGIETVDEITYTSE